MHVVFFAFFGICGSFSLMFRGFAGRIPNAVKVWIARVPKNTGRCQHVNHTYDYIAISYPSRQSKKTVLHLQTLRVFESLSVEFCALFCNWTVSSKCSSWSHSWSSASIAWTVFLQRILRPRATWCNWKKDLLWSAIDMSPQALHSVPQSALLSEQAPPVTPPWMWLHILWCETLFFYFFLHIDLRINLILALSWNNSCQQIFGLSIHTPCCSRLIKIGEFRNKGWPWLASGICIGPEIKENGVLQRWASLPWYVTFCILLPCDHRCRPEAGLRWAFCWNSASIKFFLTDKHSFIIVTTILLLIIDSNK